MFSPGCISPKRCLPSADTWRSTWDKSTQKRFFSKVRKSDSCWEWMASLFNNGYGQFTFRYRGKSYGVGAHRYIYQCLIGDVNGQYVCHTCDNRKCVNPSHLWLGDNSANMKDCYRKGRGHHEGRTLYSKLIPAQVKQARELRKRGETYQDLSKRFEVSVPTIWRAVNNRSWKHLK